MEIDLELLRKDLICVITREVMHDPVVARDGHTYERKAIEEWLSRGGLDKISPTTKIPMPRTRDEFTPNFALKKIIDIFNLYDNSNNNDNEMKSKRKKNDGKMINYDAKSLQNILSHSLIKATQPVINQQIQNLERSRTIALEKKLHAMEDLVQRMKEEKKKSKTESASSSSLEEASLTKAKFSSGRLKRLEEENMKLENEKIRLEMKISKMKQDSMKTEIKMKKMDEELLRYSNMGKTITPSSIPRKTPLPAKRNLLLDSYFSNDNSNKKFKETTY